MSLFQKPAGAAFLLVGLGNPGKKYENTRHNAGFAALDYIAVEAGVSLTRARFDGLCAEGSLAGERVLFLKPQTFMNLSGISVQKAAAYYKLPAERCIVLFDDISLEPGRLRVRREGSAGGHNGVQSVIDALGPVFPRIKIGVGAKPRPEMDLADWVLSRLTQDEQKCISARYADVKGAVECVLQGQLELAMSRYNG